MSTETIILETTIAPAPRSALGALLRAHWRFKFFGGGLMVCAFFAGYFLVQRYPMLPIQAMPVTVLDRLIGFHPETVLLYLSLWPYVPVAPWLMDQRRELNAYCLALLGLCVVGMGAFVIWPTAIPADPRWAEHPIFRAIIAVDHLNNAAPSLHAAFAIFCGLCNHQMLRHVSKWRVVGFINGCWGVGILYATLATKRHVAVDVYMGVILGALAYAGYLALSRDGSTRTALEQPARR